MYARSNYIGRNYVFVEKTDGWADRRRRRTGSTMAHAAANLKSDDFVGISFWLISMAMMASTVFFLWETQGVTAKWKTSLVVSGLITFIAAVHYFYMRDVWVSTGETPTVYRYIDWLLTVPLQMIEFYLILRAIEAAPAGIFWRLFLGTLVMIIPGFWARLVTLM